MAPLAEPEPMNATASHSKLKVSITLPHNSTTTAAVVAGRHVTGKLEVECKSDKLAIGTITVELFGFQELTSRDHSARMTFLHTKRVFQGPGLPPSNAVHALPNAVPGETPLVPEGYFRAKRGHSTFLFRIPVPLTSPASVDFAGGLARVRYEVRGSVGVFWKGGRQVVMDKAGVGVLQSYDGGSGGGGAMGVSGESEEEGVVVVGEGGRFWMHGRVVGGLGGVLVAGESACVELQVKNYSSRKNSSLTLSLRRTLVLPSTNDSKAAEPLQISDTLLNVPYKGPEYTLPPGGEGVAHLVFDVPLDARSVRGGTYEDDDNERTSEALFSVRASAEVRVNMGGFSSKDIVLDIPVTIVHPDALPNLQMQAHPQLSYQPQPSYASPLPMSVPYQTPYIDPQTHQVWLPPPHHALPLPPQPHPYYPPHQVQHPSPQHAAAAAYIHLLNLPPPPLMPQRPSSAGSVVVHTTGLSAGEYSYAPPISGLPGPSGPAPHANLFPHPTTTIPPSLSSGSFHHYTRALPQPNPRQRPPLPQPPHHPQPLLDDDVPGGGGEREEGQGVIASRISRHLRQTSVLVGRGRSVSPQAHRFGYPAAAADAVTATAGGVGVGGADNQNAPNSADVVTTTILHSPRPRITHKQSFTKDVVDGKVLERSEKVVELEEIAAGLEEEEDGAEKKMKGKEKEKDILNKTLPVPPPLTKPRHMANADVNKAKNGISLDALFDPLIPKPTPKTDTATSALNVKATEDPISPTHLASPSDTANANTYQTPPTPTLVAFKRPPKTATTDHNGKTIVAGGGESGLDALERRLLSQVGTRKVEKGPKMPNIRDILAEPPTLATTTTGLVVTPTTAATTTTRLRTPNSNSEGPGTPGTTGRGSGAGYVGAGATPSTSIRGGGGGGSVSASASSEKQDESAISSLTLDQASVESGGRNAEEGEKERAEDDEQLEQESMDGGKTHRADKSVVGVESYFHSHSTTAAAGTSETLYPPLPPQQLATTTSNGSVIPPATHAHTTTPPKKRASPPEGSRTKKSAQMRGKVAAWLGNIDPAVPPPQEDIIPPSPSVVRHPDLDGGLGGEEEEEDEDDDDDGEKVYDDDDNSGGRRHGRHRHRREGGGGRPRSISRSPLPIFVPPPPPLPQTTAPVALEAPLSDTGRDLSPTSTAAAPATPDPRSSGFMPMETMKTQRDTITKSITRSVMRRGMGVEREMTVAQEARRVMEIWSKMLPLNNEEPLKEEKKKNKVAVQQQYPFLVAVPPKTQTIRTDRKVSPPSASAPAPATILEVGELEPHAPSPVAAIAVVVEDKLKTKDLPPKSYANVAAKKNQRPLPNFPPPRLDPEVKYDIRSARGGRGGKVTQVATLWAAVAAAGGGGGASKSSESGTGGKMDVKSSWTSSTTNSGSSGPALGEARNGPKSGLGSALPNKKPANASSLLALSNTNGIPASTPRAKTPQAKTPTSLPNNKLPPSPPPNSKPKAPIPTPKIPSISTPATAPAPAKTLPKRPELPSFPNPIKKPSAKSPIIPASMTKSPSVPAMVSSSLATPTLTSTASLARPVGSGGSKTSTIPVGLPGLGKGDYKDPPGRDANSDVKEGRGGERKKSGLRVANEDAGAGISAGAGGNVWKKSGLRVVNGDAGSGGDGKPVAKGPAGGAATALANAAGGGGSEGGKPGAASSAGGEGATAVKQAPSRDMAFGQARLRDLIKKYQG